MLLILIKVYDKVQYMNIYTVVFSSQSYDIGKMNIKYSPGAEVQVRE